MAKNGEQIKPTPETAVVKSLEVLQILRDDPLFGGEESFDPQLDAFNHQAYAQALYKIVNTNKPPLSIGLFGPWGIGKSTVINILFKLIRDSDADKLHPIYFNAWKYSGDSFRRQFLIEVAKQVYAGNTDLPEKLRRLEQLNYTDVLKEEPAPGLVEQIRGLLSTRMHMRQTALVRIYLALLFMGIGGILSLLSNSTYPLPLLSKLAESPAWTG